MKDLFYVAMVLTCALVVGCGSKKNDTVNSNTSPANTDPIDKSQEDWLNQYSKGGQPPRIKLAGKVVQNDNQQLVASEGLTLDVLGGVGYTGQRAPIQTDFQPIFFETPPNYEWFGYTPSEFSAISCADSVIEEFRRQSGLKYIPLKWTWDGGLVHYLFAPISGTILMCGEIHQTWPGVRLVAKEIILDNVIYKKSPLYVSFTEFTTEKLTLKGRNIINLNELPHRVSSIVGSSSFNLQVHKELMREQNSSLHIWAHGADHVQVRRSP